MTKQTPHMETQTDKQSRTDCYLYKLLHEWETVSTLIRCRSKRRLIWVYIVCYGLFVKILEQIRQIKMMFLPTTKRETPYRISREKLITNLVLMTKTAQRKIENYRFCLNIHWISFRRRLSAKYWKQNDCSQVQNNRFVTFNTKSTLAVDRFIRKRVFIFPFHPV